MEELLKSKLEEFLAELRKAKESPEQVDKEMREVAKDEGAANPHMGHSAFNMDHVNEIAGMKDHAAAKARAHEIVDGSSANLKNRVKIKKMIDSSKSVAHLAMGMSNHVLAHPGEGLRVIKGEHCTFAKNGQWTLHKKVRDEDTSSENTDESINPALGGKYGKIHGDDPRKAGMWTSRSDETSIAQGRPNSGHELIGPAGSDVSLPEKVGGKWRKRVSGASDLRHENKGVKANEAGKELDKAEEVPKWKVPDPKQHKIDDHFIRRPIEDKPDKRWRNIKRNEGKPDIPWPNQHKIKIDDHIIPPKNRRIKE